MRLITRRSLVSFLHERCKFGVDDSYSYEKFLAQYKRFKRFDKFDSIREIIKSDIDDRMCDEILCSYFFM